MPRGSPTRPTSRAPFLSPGYQGTLGWGYATSLGAKVAKPDTPVLSISGDGGFLFTAMEMSTAAQNGIGVVAGRVQRWCLRQRQAHPAAGLQGPHHRLDLHNPDFVKLAESFGIASERARSPAELGAAITRGFARGGPTLIDCPVGRLP
jgi:acetolactate synthase-1/2/3 large subunit